MQVQREAVFLRQGEYLVDVAHGVVGKERVARDEVDLPGLRGSAELPVVLRRPLGDVIEVQPAPVLLLQLVDGLKGAHAPLWAHQHMALHRAGA